MTTDQNTKPQKSLESIMNSNIELYQAVLKDDPDNEWYKGALQTHVAALLEFKFQAPVVAKE